MTAADRGCTRELGERAVASVGRHVEWRADARLAAVGAVMWTGMAGCVAVRRRLGRRNGAVPVTTAVAVAGVVATSLTLPAPPLLRAYSVLTTAVMLLAPITVVAFPVRMQAARDLARPLAVTDPLTGLSNRRGIGARAGSILAAAAAAGEPVTVRVLDPGHVQTVDDTHGHAVGDRVRTEVAGAMTRDARRRPVRLSGEELG